MKSRIPPFPSPFACAGFSHLRLYAIENPGAQNPDLWFYDIEIENCSNGGTSFVADESQSTFDAMDGRIVAAKMQKVAGDVRLYVAQQVIEGVEVDSPSISIDLQTQIRWYEIDLGSWPFSGDPSLESSGQIDGGLVDIGSGQVDERARHLIYPGMTVAVDGNLAFSFAQTSVAEKLSVGVAIWDGATVEFATAAPSDEAGPMPEDEFGRYFAVVPDQLTAGQFWSFGAYVSDYIGWSGLSLGVLPLALRAVGGVVMRGVLLILFVAVSAHAQQSWYTTWQWLSDVEVAPDAKSAKVTLSVAFEYNFPWGAFSGAHFDTLMTSGFEYGSITDWDVLNALDVATGDNTETDGKSLFGTYAAQFYDGVFFTEDNPIDVIEFVWEADAGVLIAPGGAPVTWETVFRQGQGGVNKAGLWLGEDDNLAFAVGPDEFYYADIGFTVIPAPATLCLLGLAACRRRRR